MSLVYKIHPGVGVARVGPSTDGCFLAGERPGGAPVDIVGGSETQFRGYKDASSLMRRQGARFRVYEYLRDDATGALTPQREITAADADVRWSVSLAAGKAAGKQMVPALGPDGKRTLVPGAANRNDPPPGFSRDDLVARVQLEVAGRNATSPPGTGSGTIVGREVFLGEALTDDRGRLIVLGGRGASASWDNLPTREFLNNPTWYDDIADGSVDATVTLPGQAPMQAVGAWVITGPPDFAPDVVPLTTLLDIAEQAVSAPLPSSLTYPQDIEPILERAANLHFVNSKSSWAAVYTNFTTLADLGSNQPSARTSRSKTRDSVVLAAGGMSDYTLTKRQVQVLDAWVNGTFDEQPAARPLPEGVLLDRASLDRCVGGGFFPGIEAGTLLRERSVYAEMGRFTRGNFVDHDGTSRPVEPGLFGSRMACPWQADFSECEGAWWPSQRPDIAGRTANDAAGPLWARGVIANGNSEDPQTHANMIDRFARLGLVVRSGSGFGEIGRDPTLPNQA